MAQFGTSTYGSKFPTLSASKGYFTLNPTNTTPTGGLGQLLAAAGVGGSPFSYQAPTFDTPTVTPSDQVKDAQAPESSFDPSAGAKGLSFGANGPSMDDLGNDPILQQIRSAGQRRVQDARSGALASAENAIIGYGGLQGTDALKGLYAADQSNPIYAALLDANTAKAAEANPDSTLKQLATRDTRNIASIDNQRNLQNLFYSSTRANDLGGEATNYRQAQNQAAGSLAALLGGANQGVLDAQQSSEDAYLNALSGAWDRWLTMQQLLGSGSKPPPSGGQPVPDDQAYYYTTPGVGNGGMTTQIPIARPGRPIYT